MKYKSNQHRMERLKELFFQNGYQQAIDTLWLWIKQDIFNKNEFQYASSMIEDLKRNFHFVDGAEETKFRWGFDGDGELALCDGEIMYIYHKWSEPIVLHKSKDRMSFEEFQPFDDSNSKIAWRKLRKFEIGEI